MMSPLHESAYRKLAAGYRTDPAGYARDVLGFSPTVAQSAIAAALVRPPYRVLVPSANITGKTTLNGWLINWHHDTFDPGVVMATSSSYRQVQTQLFKEVRRLRPFNLGLQPRSPEITHTPAHFVLGFSTNKADSFQGQHEAALLLVFDEATGVHADFWDRGETMFQGHGGHAWICTYNPHDTTTPAYAAEQGGGWAVVRLSALDHPNIPAELRGEPPPVPSAVRLARVEARILKQCEFLGESPGTEEGAFLWPPVAVRAVVKKDAGSIPWGWYKPADPLFEVQVLGRWPSAGFRSVWSPADIRKAKRVIDIDESWPVQIGCDMARGGTNKIVITVRKGVAVVHIEEMPSSTRSPEVASRLRSLAWEWAPKGTSPKRVPVLIDDTGGYGSGVVDYPEGFWFVGVNSSSAARDSERYPNVRSEMWWTTRLAFDEGAFCLGNVGVGREHLANVEQDYLSSRYSLDSKLRRVIEGKDKVKERLKRSPDYADSINLSFYGVPGEE
jgi:hypothetical protein